MRVVNATPGTGALASIYAVDSTASPIAGSVVTTDSTGTFNFYAPDGRYDLVVAFGATTKIVADIEIADITEGNTGDLPWLVRNFESIRYADQFPGADYGIKIANAIADLPASGGIVDARGFSGTFDTATNPFATVTAPTLVIFGCGLYRSSVQWVQNNSFLSVIGQGRAQTTLQYTGAAVTSFIKISTATPTISVIQEIKWQAMTIKGSANTTDAFLIAGVHRSIFDEIDFKDATQACFHSTWAVTNTYKNLSCSTQVGDLFVHIPTYGFMFDSIGGLQTTDGTVIDIHCEGIQTGLYLKSASSMTFTSGTSENNTATVGGVQIDSASANNIFLGTDFELNTGGTDVLDNGNSNIFIDIIAISATGFKMGPTSVKSQIIGGNVPLIVVDPAATNPGGIQSSSQQIGTSSGGGASSGIQMIAPIPGVYWKNTGGGADAKNWDTVVGGNSLLFRTLSDNFGSAINWLVATRTGISAVALDFSAAQSTTFPPSAFTGKIVTYNNIATAGEGLASVRAITSQKAETAADTNVLTFIPPAVAGRYRIGFTLSVSAATAAVVGWTATWKNSNGTAKAPTNLSLFQAGAAAPALTFTTSTTDDFYGEALIDIDNSATAIVIKFTMGSGTITAKASATIERLI